MATNLYVGNLPYTVNNDQLWQMFAAYGDVVSANVIVDRSSGQSKGFGFVEMAADAAAQQAITELNGSQMGNRAIVVNIAQPRQDRAGGGGGYGDRPPRRNDYGGGERRERRW